MASFERKWSPADVVRSIQQAAALGRVLNYGAITQENAALVRAGERLFGSWGAAVVAAGLDYSAICRYRKWSRTRVIERIRELHVQGQDLSWHNISTTIDPALAAAALRPGRFESWSDALLAAGLKPEAIIRYRHWTPQELACRLNDYIQSGQPFTQQGLKEHAPALLAAIYRICGNLPAALQLNNLHRFGND